MVIKEIFVFASRIISDFKRMTAEATIQSLRCFDDVLSITTPGFSRNNIYKIRAISVCVFDDFDAVSITIDGGCDG